MPISSMTRGGSSTRDTLPAPTPVHRSSPTLRRRISRRRRRAPRLTWQSASFHFSLVTTLIVIALLWSIAPLSVAYLVYTILTWTIPRARPYRPAPDHLALQVVHYIFLAYCSLELPFTLLYRYLSWKEQKLRKPLRHSRNHLRGLILRSLENGLTIDQEFEQEEHDHVQENERRHGQQGEDDHDRKNTARDGVLRVSSSPVEEQKPEQSWVEGNGPSNSRVNPPLKVTRVNRSKGDGPGTPEITPSDGSDYLSAREQLPTLRTNDPVPPLPRLNLSGSRSSTLDSPVEVDEGFAGSRVSLDSAFVSNSSPRKLRQKPTYPPSMHSQSPYTHQHQPTSKLPLPTSKYIQPPLTPSDARAIDFRNYLRYWFAGCEFSEIKRLNMADWMAWSLYGMTLEQLEEERKEWDKMGRPRWLKLEDGVTDDKDHDDRSSSSSSAGDDAVGEEEEEIEGDKYGLVMHCVEMVEARAAHRFEPGRNEGIKTLRLTLDPVKVTQRPLILYLVVALLQNGVLAATKLKGFKQLRDGKVKYLCRVPKEWIPNRNGDESTKPLVFIHGLGMGSAQYATFMSYLCSHRSFRNRPLLILLQPHISMSFFERAYHDPPDQTTLVTSLERMMKRLKFDQAGGATVLSHSNGTIVHGWLAKAAPSLCARNCFVDPVCFCLWEPFVCYNFLYSKPKTPIEYLMRYFVSRELGIAIMLSRTFEWTSNLLFPSQIPNLSDPTKSAVFLASQDSILNAERVKTYLKRNGFTETISRNAMTTSEGGAPSSGGRLKVFEGLKHGQSMIGEGEAFEEIMEWVCRAPRGTLAPGTASPNPSLPPSLASSGVEEDAGTASSSGL